MLLLGFLPSSGSAEMWSFLDSQLSSSGSGLLSAFFFFWVLLFSFELLSGYDPFGMCSYCSELSGVAVGRY